MNRLLQLSGVIVDIIYHVEEVPVAGEEAIVDRFYMCAGGGFNAMVAARRSGMKATYGGGLGQGPLAEVVTRQFKEESIVAIQSPQAGRDQGCCTVLIDRSGERTFVASEGADGVLTPAQLAEIDPDQFDWILISGYALVYEGSRDAVSDWIDKLPADSCVVFDPCPLVASIPETVLNKVMARCSWVSCNAREATYLTGQSDVIEAVKRLATSSPESGGAVIRHGKSGCTLATDQTNAFAISGFKVDAIDTNGAGDAHVGTFIAGLSRKLDPYDACVVANAAAALSTTISGPATTPQLDDVQRFISRFADSDVGESIHPR